MPGQVCFSHGQESGPWGTKIRAMAEVAQAAGWDVESLDYQGIQDPRERAERLLAHCATLPEPPLLVGSSMGGFVALAVAARIPVRGLFLLAPALYLPGYQEYLPAAAPRCPTQIVHGWRDDVVPWRGSLRWGEMTGARLLLLDADHRLTSCVAVICGVLKEFILELGDAI